MSEKELLDQVVARYRSEGYDVRVHPRAEELPEFLSGVSVDLLARNDRESVVVEVKRRDELYDIPSWAELVRATPGWRFDLVVVPMNGSSEAPPVEAELAPDAIESL